jgi:hypothetical protein
MASLRKFSSHENVLSTTHRLGRGLNPLDLSDRKVISMSHPKSFLTFYANAPR